MRIEHLTAHKRFVARIPGGDAVLIYEMRSTGVLDVLSTFVPVAARGQGVGGALVEAVMVHAQAHRLRIIPTCWYVESWVDRHPQYRRMLVN